MVKKLEVVKQQDLVLRLLAEGDSLRAICKKHRIGRSTVAKWRAESEDFEDRYACAREDGYEVHADQLLAIAAGTDGKRKKTDAQLIEMTQRDRLRVDTIKWLLSKRSATYSDRQRIEHEGGVQIQVVTGVPPRREQIEGEG